MSVSSSATSIHLRWKVPTYINAPLLSYRVTVDRVDQTDIPKVCVRYPGLPLLSLLSIASLPAATKLGQGNVFTGVCDSVNRGGACWDPPKSRHPPEQTPLQSRHPPPKSRHPPGADTSPGRRHPPGSRHPARADTPQEQTPPRSRHPQRADPPQSRHRHTVNERPVRILLECILVYNIFILSWTPAKNDMQ